MTTFIFCRMQFSHVSDMTTEEILDYAVLYGNDTSHLHIKSFSHLEVRNFDETDWISIFLDLMVAFLGVENPLALRNHSTTKGIRNSIKKIIGRDKHHLMHFRPLWSRWPTDVQAPSVRINCESKQKVLHTMSHSISLRNFSRNGRIPVAQPRT